MVFLLNFNYGGDEWELIGNGGMVNGWWDDACDYFLINFFIIF